METRIFQGRRRAQAASDATRNFIPILTANAKYPFTRQWQVFHL